VLLEYVIIFAGEKSGLSIISYDILIMGRLRGSESLITVHAREKRDECKKDNSCC
jgi:hypothetical protein